MRIIRLGELNQEQPAVVISNTEAVFVDDLMADFNRAELENGAIDKLKKADLRSRSKVVIADELAEKKLSPSNLSSSCTVDGELRQNLSTNDLIFGINHCIWYISQFMKLKAGDVINTGTPGGVGMGLKPEKFLKGGEVIVTTIKRIGAIKNKVVNFK